MTTGRGRQPGSIDALRAMSLREIARELGVSVAYVSNTERTALKKLRRNARARKLFEEFVRKGAS